MPQMYSLDSFLFGIILIILINLTTNTISSKIRGIYRIGPHNKGILSVVYGSLLGDAHAEKGLSGVGTRISFFQEDTHLKYIFYLHNLLSKAGYCNSKLPIIGERLGVKGKVRKIARFST
jgi:ubiquinol-cytochrome c reductase cytochrome b subunit